VAAVRLDRDLAAVFVPGDPPRAGGFAVWGDGHASDDIELVLPAGRGVRRRRVRGRLLPLVTALPALLTASADEVGSALAAWSAAAAAGVGLVARGRLLPAASAGGYDAWRVGPLDAPDLEWLGRIAAAMPPQAHALPVDGSRPIRVRSPEALIRELWDAIADTLLAGGVAVRATVQPTPAPAGAAEPTFRLDACCGSGGS
jgi:hypothetical protein